MTKYIATLDAAGTLIGKKKVPDDHDGGIDPGDLPVDGRYKWNDVAKSFVPLGHGFGKVRNGNPPVSFEAALASIIEAMGDNAPADAAAWLDWWSSDIGKRESESNQARLIRRRSGR